MAWVAPLGFGFAIEEESIIFVFTQKLQQAFWDLMVRNPPGLTC